MAFTVTILDNTAIDPQSSVGFGGSGWVARVDTTDTTNITNTVVADQLVLTVQDPGYDSTKASVTRTRTIKGIAHLRRVYPNGASKMISTAAGTTSIWVTLEDFIYSGSTVTAATVSSTFYSGMSAASASSITNNSVEAYPLVLHAWAVPQLEMSTGTLDVEGVFSHRHGMLGQQIACAEYSATDGTTTTSAVLVSVPALAKRISGELKPETWQASLNVSGLTQGTACTVNAKGYPWIGNNPLDLTTDGVAWPTQLPLTKLKFLCNRTGAYGPAYAYVKVGAAGGTVSATAATARAAPFPDVPSALSAIQTFNNANNGHNDLGGGHVRLMDAAGANVTHTMNGDGPYTTASTWCYVEKDPLSSGEVSLTWDALRQASNMMAYGGNGLILAPTPGQWGISGNLSAGEYVLLNDCNFRVSGGDSNLRMCLQDNRIFFNVKVVGTGSINFSAFSGSAPGSLLLTAGVITNTVTSPDTAPAHCMLGCKIPRMALGLIDGDGADTSFIQNNFFYSGIFANTGSITSYPKGITVLQNLFVTDTVSGNNCMNMFADGDHSTFTNYIEMYNTAVGERCSHLYNDDATSKVVPIGLIKKGTLKFNIWDNINLKGDTFNSGAGSTGGVAMMYGVGNYGNVSLFGQVGRGAGDLPHNDNADVPYLGMAWHPLSEPNLFKTANGLTLVQIMRLFRSYCTTPKSTGGALGGNYQLSANYPQLKSRVPVGLGALKFDIIGNSRLTNGTGSPGAFEWNIVPTRVTGAFQRRSAETI